MNLIKLCVLPMILCGCTPDLVRSANTIPVPTPVREQCIAVADIPNIPPRHMPRSGSVDQLAAGASADFRELDAYSQQADALLRSCAAQPKEK